MRFQTTTELTVAEAPKSTCHQALGSAFVAVTEPSTKFPSYCHPRRPRRHRVGVSRKGAALGGQLALRQIGERRAGADHLDLGEAQIAGELHGRTRCRIATPRIPALRAVDRNGSARDWAPRSDGCERPGAVL